MENRTVCNDRLQEYMKEVKLLQSYDEVQDLITLATQEKWLVPDLSERVVKKRI